MLDPLLTNATPSESNMNCKTDRDPKKSYLHPTLYSKQPSLTPVIDSNMSTPQRWMISPTEAHIPLVAEPIIMGSEVNQPRKYHTHSLVEYSKVTKCDPIRSARKQPWLPIIAVQIQIMNFY